MPKWPNNVRTAHLPTYTAQFCHMHISWDLPRYDWKLAHMHIQDGYLNGWIMHSELPEELPPIYQLYCLILVSVSLLRWDPGQWTYGNVAYVHIQYSCLSGWIILHSEQDIAVVSSFSELLVYNSNYSKLLEHVLPFCKCYWSGYPVNAGSVTSWWCYMV